MNLSTSSQVFLCISKLYDYLRKKKKRNVTTPAILYDEKEERKVITLCLKIYLNEKKRKTRQYNSLSLFAN